MINNVIFQEYLKKYKLALQKIWDAEKYKWIAVKHFQTHWAIDAVDFADMLNKSLAKAKTLLDSGFAYPRAMLVGFAQEDSEATRLAMQNLFDESKPLSDRIEAFIAFADDRKANHNADGWKNHYQDLLIKKQIHCYIKSSQLRLVTITIQHVDPLALFYIYVL